MEILPCQKMLTGRPEGNYKSIILLLVVIVKFNWRCQVYIPIETIGTGKQLLYINLYTIAPIESYEILSTFPYELRKEVGKTDIKAGDRS